MERQLHLVQSDFEQLEKRILPRFPFCFLTFKCSKDLSHAFEVKDISSSGMQIALKSGEHNLKDGEHITGNLSWSGRSLEIQGVIKWSNKRRLGIEFSNEINNRKNVLEFLSVEKIAKELKPVHKLDFGGEVPAKLKYWLRADGPVEIFIWQHSDGELASFQILIMENFIEWEDGKGLKSARIISKRNIDTPLITEDEFVFKHDDVLDEEKLDKARILVEGISQELLSSGALGFLKVKLQS